MRKACQNLYLAAISDYTWDYYKLSQRERSLRRRQRFSALVLEGFSFFDSAGRIATSFIERSPFRIALLVAAVPATLLLLKDFQYPRNMFLFEIQILRAMRQLCPLLAIAQLSHTITTSTQTYHQTTTHTHTHTHKFLAFIDVIIYLNEIDLRV